MPRSRIRQCLALLVTLSLPVWLSAQEKARFASLQDAMRAGGVLGGGYGPRDVNWIDGGRRYSYIARSDSGESIHITAPATGLDSLLFRAEGLTFPDTAEPFEYESFQWAHDSKHLVFQTHFQQLYRRSGTSDYYVYALADHSLALGARGARTAELSPDGALMGYERDGDLFTYDLAAAKETRLTDDATPTRYNGHFDWVYEEEFGLAQAWSWSPDSRHIAYWQTMKARSPCCSSRTSRARIPTGPRSASRSPAIRIPQWRSASSTSGRVTACGSTPASPASTTCRASTGPAGRIRSRCSPSTGRRTSSSSTSSMSGPGASAWCSRIPRTPGSTCTISTPACRT